MQRYNEEIQRAIERIEVWQANCNGYYRSPSGRVVTQWPHSMSEFQSQRHTRTPDPGAFEVARR
jgi:protocatechuate 3,4-dioxygenase beta subunit